MNELPSPTLIHEQSLPNQPADRLISKSEVRIRIGKSDTFIEEWTREGRFPPAIRVGRNAMYLEREIQQWILQRVAESRGITC